MGSELDEKNFIKEKSSKYTWIFLTIFLIITLLIWGLGQWQWSLLKEKTKEYRFYQVTNREFSLFLWQNPRFMRANVMHKLGYLPHFDSEDDIHLLPEYADLYVAAPQDVLFLFHVWNRLIGKSLGPAPILANEFYKFIHDNQEWLPQYWESAPKEYVSLVEKLPLLGDQELQGLPFEVKMAFQGWKNYSVQWERIERVQPTYKEMGEFLAKHVEYNRSFWRNILEKRRPEYLISFLRGPTSFTANPEERVSEDDLSDFLKIGYFNFVLAVQQ